MRLSVAALVLALAAPAAFAAPDWPVPRGPAHDPDPHVYNPADLAAVPRAALDDAPACILFSRVSYTVEPDGTTETVSHDLTRLNTHKAVDQLGEYKNIVFDPAYEKVTLNEARVHKPDGRTVPVEPRHVQLRDVGTDFQVYDTGRQLVISFPSLAPGDVIEVKWTVRGQNPEYAGRFFSVYGFGDDHHPVHRDELRIRVPKKMELKHAVVRPTAGPPGPADFGPRVTEDAATRTYSWAVDDREPPPQESHLPNKEAFHLQVAASTFASWEEVARWKRGLRADCWECTEELRKTAREVTAKCQSPLEKARALTHWVRTNVRYLSAGQKHDFTPHPPAVVAANRFGDCKDQSQLLAVMLREAGVPVGLATLGVRGDGQIVEAVPSPWGTHAIVVATVGGKDHWIDTTLNQVPWDFLPADDRDRLCYVVDEKSVRLVRTPSLTADDNRTEQTTELSVGPDGSARGTRTATYAGIAAQGRRGDFADTPAADRRRVVSGELLDAQAHARLRKLTVDEAALADPDQPVVGRVVYEVPDQFTGSPKREGSVSDSQVWNALLAYTVGPERTVPIDLGSPQESTHRYVIRLPAAYVRDTAEESALPQVVDSKWLRFEVRRDDSASGPHQLALEFRLRLTKTTVEPADFEAFRAVQDRVTKAYRYYLTLQPATDPADLAVLGAVVQLVPGDRDSAAVLAKGLLDAGQDEAALAVARRALDHHPDDAGLWELAVQAARDADQEIELRRELVKQFPSEDRYQLELAERLVATGELDDADKLLDKLTHAKSTATQAKAHLALADVALERLEPKAALRHVQEAERIDPEAAGEASALVLKGTVHERLKHPKEALAAFRAALGRDPESHEAMEGEVRLAFATGEKEAALRTLRRLTVLAGDEPDELAFAAEWHLRLGRTDDAAELAGRVKQPDQHPAVLRVLGLIALERGDDRKAAELLVQTEPDAAGLDGRLRALIHLGRLTEAGQQAEAAKLLDDPTEALTATVATVRALEQRRDELLRSLPGAGEKSRVATEAFVCAEHLASAKSAPAAVESLLAAATTEQAPVGPAFALRGRLALESGRLRKAQADADRAVELAPNDAAGYLLRGRVRLEAGRDGAVADLDKAAALTGRKDAAALHWLAAALAQAGKSAEAGAVKREADGLKPADADLAERLKEWPVPASGAGR
jgi:tetratricopeptide (TPR) repeat protein/transglutaminase-like putative cysteine protease